LLAFLVSRDGMRSCSRLGVVVVACDVDQFLVRAVVVGFHGVGSAWWWMNGHILMAYVLHPEDLRPV